MAFDLIIKNFKCLSHATLKIAPLTLLTGLNGAGKSSVIQSLLTLRQSFQSGDLQKGFLCTSGDLIDLGAPKEVLFEGADADCIGIALRPLDGEKKLIQFEFSVEPDRPTAIAKDMVAHTQAVHQMLIPDNLAALLRGRDQLKSPVLGLHYLNAERNGPRKYLPMSASSGRIFDIGKRGEFVLHALHEYQDAIQFTSDDPRLITNSSERLREQLEIWLNEISPGAHLDLTPVSQADLIVGSFSFGEEGKLRSREYRATNVGFGISYVLPVLAALLGLSKGEVLLIENPEAHLHPRGQTKMGELCARAAAAGIQVVVETHSDHFMDGIRIAIREGILKSDQAAFHYFNRSASGTNVVSPDIDDQGRLSSWPDGFFDQHRRNTARLVMPKSR